MKALECALHELLVCATAGLQLVMAGYCSMLDAFQRRMLRPD